MTTAPHCTRFLLVRHGQTRANADKYVGGSTDDPLTETGHEQARRVADRLSDSMPEAIYTSPLKRALQTAAHIGSATGVSPQVVDSLAEWDAGDWEKLRYSEIPAQPGFKFEHLQDPDWAPPGGESLGSVQDRVVETVQQLADQHPGDNVIIVSHGTALGLLLAKLFHSNTGAWTQYRLENCSLSELTFCEQPELVLSNQTDHLKGI